MTTLRIPAATRTPLRSGPRHARRHLLRAAALLCTLSLTASRSLALTPERLERAQSALAAPAAHQIPAPAADDLLPHRIIRPLPPPPPPAPVVKPVVKPKPAPAKPAAQKPAQPAPRPVKPAPPKRSLRERALAGIRFPIERIPPFTLHFLPPRKGFLGVTDIKARRVEIYVRPSWSDYELSLITAYEIAHLLDGYGDALTWEEREQWLYPRGRPDAEWFSCEFCNEDDVGSGDFADVFVLHTVGPGFFRARVAPPPTPAQMAELVPFFYAHLR